MSAAGKGAAGTAGDGGSVTLRKAVGADTPAVLDLLRAADLPVDGVPDVLTHLVVAVRDTGAGSEIVGAVALERHGSAALLRSTVVAPSMRGTGLGERLVRRALEDARTQALEELVLLTTTAAEWFPRFGFERIARDEAPASLLASEEFQFACPASAVVMRYKV